MPQHEQKICPCCNQLLECKVGDIVHCQCSSIYLTLEERSFIEDHCSD